jgi:hypothetical protein
VRLTAKNRAYIDALDYQALLRRWRFATAGDHWFQDKTGQYWKERMTELRSQDAGAAIRASKDIGWE